MAELRGIDSQKYVFNLFSLNFILFDGAIGFEMTNFKTSEKKSQI